MGGFAYCPELTITKKAHPFYLPVKRDGF